MGNIQATVCILTFNSAKTLRRALDSVRDFDELLLCDGGSTDDTLQIAREYGARIIPQDTKYLRPDGRIKDYAGVRNQCLDAARHDWFLYIDADETISRGLHDAIREITSKTQPKRRAYRVPLKIIMDGRSIEHSSNYPGYQYRFFDRRAGARFVKPVHERVDIDPNKISVGALEHPWHTHTTRAYWRHFIRHAAYYRPLEVQMFCNAPFHAYMRFVVWRNVRVALGTIVKAARNYAVHGFKDSMPLSAEWARVVIPLQLAWGVTLCKLWRLIKRS